MSKVSREFYLANQAYARVLDAMEPQAYERYVSALECAGGRILDVGCGTGTAVRMLRDRGCEAVGCDISPEFIELAMSKAGKWFSLIRPDGTLPYDNGSFDSVGSFNVLEHVEAPGAFLDEVCRVLRPGGTLVLATPNMLSLTWPRPRQGIHSLWRVRMLNAVLLMQRALRLTRREDEFVTVQCWLDMADFAPDHDAVCLTNYFDIRRALHRRGLRLRSYTATERKHHGPSARVTEAIFASPLGWVLGAVFVVATKAEKLEQ